MTVYANPTFDMGRFGAAPASAGYGDNFFLPSYGTSPAVSGVDAAVSAVNAPNMSMAMAPNTATTPAAVNPINSYLASQAAPTAAAPSAAIAPNGIGAVLGTNTNSFPVAPGASNTPTSSTSLGMNTGTMGLILGGIQTIGSLWQAWEANKLAKKQFAFSKEFANANLDNSIQSYNTTLAGETAARAGYEGWSDKKEDRYVRNNELSRK